MKIAQLSDFHYAMLPWNPLSLFSKRILGTLNWLLFRRNHFFEEQIEPLPSLFEELGVDLVLLGGDFSTTSLMGEFEKAKQLIKKIKQPWIAIPGNHDHYTYRSFRQKHFYRFFSNKRKEIAHKCDFFTLKEHGIEAHLIQEGWWVVALDTAIATNPYSSRGLFSQKLKSRLEEVLELIGKESSIILLNHYPFFQNDEHRHTLAEGEELEKILKKNPQIRLYLHGHTHRQTVADLQPSQLPIILDSGSCSHRKKGAWNLIELKDEGCSISTYRWDHRWAKTRTEDFQWIR